MTTRSRTLPERGKDETMNGKSDDKPNLVKVRVGPASKRCTGCNQTKPLDEFYKDRRNSDGRYSECKDCIKQRRKQDAPKRRAAANARRAADPEAARSRDRAYYRAHRQERIDAQMRYLARQRAEKEVEGT